MNRPDVSVSRCGAACDLLRARKRWIAVCCLAALFGLMGCQGGGAGGGGGGGRRAIERGPAPAYADAAARYSEVVRHYDHLWTPIAFRLRYRDMEKDRLVEDLADGHLQVIAPDRLALRVDKLSETYFYMGSDATRYWWIDVKGSAAVVGRHDTVTEELIEELGIPVHPLELVELLGVVGMDPDGYGTTKWSPDGRRLGIVTRGRFGNTLVWVDPTTYMPTSVEVTDSTGRTTLKSELTRPRRIRQDDAADLRVEIATQVVVNFADGETRLTIRMEDPENRRVRVREAAFQLDSVLHAYRVRDVEDLDAPAGPQ